MTNSDKRFLFICILIFQCTQFLHSTNNQTYMASFFEPFKYDCTVMGNVIYADGIGRHSISLIDMLKNDCKVNFIDSRQGIVLSDIKENICTVLRSIDKSPGVVSFFTDILWADFSISKLNLTRTSRIKLAYSVFESTAIPKKSVKLINEKFDAIVVPDEFVKQTYKKSGVLVPIFVIPLGIYLDKFLDQPVKTKANDIFTFGMSGAFLDRKNHNLLVDAFAWEFSQLENVRLVIHGRVGDESIINQLEKKIAYYGKNIELIKGPFTDDQYVKFMSSLDCYVFLSKGEAFSITPREALALGIPCILSNNSAHTTICHTGLVYPIECKIKEPAYYIEIKGNSGYFHNCKIEDVRKGLRDVYENYNYHLEKAASRREWVKTYSLDNLKAKFLTLIKPKKVELGLENEVYEDKIVTNSVSLYKKYSFLKNVRYPNLR